MKTHTHIHTQQKRTLNALNHNHIKLTMSMFLKAFFENLLTGMQQTSRGVRV